MIPGSVYTSTTQRILTTFDTPWLATPYPTAMVLGLHVASTEVEASLEHLHVFAGNWGSCETLRGNVLLQNRKWAGQSMTRSFCAPRKQLALGELWSMLG